MFETKHGKAQWEIITAVLETKNIGDTVTDEELLVALGPDFPEASLNGVMWNAIRKFRDRKRTFDRVRKTGWIMVEATEHSRLARKQQLKSKRRLADAVSISASTDLSLLNPEERRAQNAEELHFRQLLASVSRRVKRLEIAHEKIDQRVGVVEKVQDNVDDRIDRLKDLLRRHGITDDE